MDEGKLINCIAANLTVLTNTSIYAISVGKLEYFMLLHVHSALTLDD